MHCPRSLTASDGGGEIKIKGKGESQELGGSRTEQGLGEFPSDLKGWEMALLSRHKLFKEQLQPNTSRAARTDLTSGQKNCTGSPFLVGFRHFHPQFKCHLQRGLRDLQPTTLHSVKLIT